MKKLLLATPLVFIFFFQLHAVEGMWIPKLLQELNETEMHEMGMRISAEEIYAVNQSSLKDAIMLFGRGCTASLISEDGLLLTNHHCAFGTIRRHSTVDNDLLKHGFWAKSREEELVNPGLTVTRLVEMQDVSARVLEAVLPDMNEAERKAAIDQISRAISDEAMQQGPYDASVRAFFHGNNYYLLLTQTFHDVRLVGAPPSGIGKFGGDTDNWMWPRHTGDFALFRVYADTNNKPAAFSRSNRAYRPDKHLQVSPQGVDEGDFAFVYGFPGRTSSYLPSQAVELIAETANPHKVALRGLRLDVFKRYMDADPEVRLKYASKDAGVANGWKKMMGETNGIRRLDAIAKKHQLEQQFAIWVAEGDEDRRQAYQGILPAFADAYERYEPYSLATDYMNEAGRAIELIGFASRFRALLEPGNQPDEDGARQQMIIHGLKRQTEAFFRDYHQPIDEEVAHGLLSLYINNLPPDLRPAFVNEINIRYRGDVAKYVGRLFGKSMFVDKDAVLAFLDNYKPRHARRLQKDPAYAAADDIRVLFDSRIREPRQRLLTSIDSLQRLYMAGLMEMQPEKRFHADANGTLRVSYGLVEGYSPADAIYYNHFTTLDGIIEKENPEVYDYRVPPRLKKLHGQADYGPYADNNGHMRVAFTASNHTTGGSSGSPVLNADGHLVGLNFDRCWEATMSDLVYDPVQGRNISVDIRYILFIIDKFADAGYLVDEMRISFE